MGRLVTGLLLVLVLAPGAALAQEGGDPYESPAGDPYGDPYGSPFGAPETAYGSHFNVVVGNNSLHDVPGTLGDQLELGLQFDFRPPGWMNTFLFGGVLLGVSDTRPDGIWAGADEIDLGVRQYLEIPDMPYSFHYGGGVAFVDYAEYDEFAGDAEVFSDSGTGYWYGVGVSFRLGARMSLGLDYSVSHADMAGGVDIGGTHVGVVLGWGLGAGKN